MHNLVTRKVTIKQISMTHNMKYKNKKCLIRTRNIKKTLPIRTQHFVHKTQHIKNVHFKKHKKQQKSIC